MNGNLSKKLGDIGIGIFHGIIHLEMKFILTSLDKIKKNESSCKPQIKRFLIVINKLLPMLILIIENVIDLMLARFFHSIRYIWLVTSGCWILWRIEKN